MKLQVTPEWCLAMARREGDLEVGAGPRAPNAEPAGDAQTDPGTRIAFGRFVHLLRRQCGYSIEQLAAQASVDIGELMRVEDDLQYVPEPRTVYQLARTFQLPNQRLLQLAGLAVAKDVRLRDAAVKFAARSESVQALSEDERRALEQFIRVLSERVEGDDAPSQR